MTYRDISIKIEESPRFQEPNGVVDGNGKMVYKATTKYGRSFATTPDGAIDGAKRAIDQGLDG